ncbi:MAG: F0F1 ATP synthase subunit alpha, partial [Flavobacteriia bacterium]|nr:F0F1 ATP synthase subunit alpha [Flavobacteriia bacterium]
FAKFGSDLDAATMNVINKGRRNVEILKQKVNDPMSVEKQVAIIYVGTKAMLNSVPVDKIKAFENGFLEYMESKHQDVLDAIRGGAWGDAQIEAIEKAAKEVLPAYQA